MIATALRLTRCCQLLIAITGFSAASAAEIVGTPLSPWQSGYLDIHQIATGRGNAALVIGPDGTSVMIDAGEASGTPDVITPIRPDESRRSGEWIARYAMRHLKSTGHVRLDYFVATHLHPDHIGGVGSRNPTSARDPSYVLTGVTDVAEQVPIGVLIDRGYPDYAYPSRWTAAYAANYIAFVQSRVKAGFRCERVRIGAVDQIALSYHADAYPEFNVRVLAGNGEVWTGKDSATSSIVPPLSALEKSDYPDENMCSIALRFSYGAFDYFTAGDLHCDTRFGDQPWRDIETLAARASGPVEVAVADHHGYFDAVGVESVRALQPQVWVAPTWHITHLTMAVLERMVSERLYAGARDVFATDLLPATIAANDRFIQHVKSTSGHIVVRVSPGGGEYYVYITDSGNEDDIVKASFGPYICR